VTSCPVSTHETAMSRLQKGRLRRIENMNGRRADKRELKLPAGAMFHEGIAAGWAQGYSRGSFGRRLRCFAPILDRNVERGRAWLDLGCGSGVMTKELLDRGANVLAVDGSPSMLREAKASLGRENCSELTWLQSDVQCLSQLTDGCLDGVLCSSVVEYVERPEALLTEAARVLRPGGRMILSIPPKWSAVRTAQKVIRRATQCVGRDMFPYLAVSRFEIEPSFVHDWLSKSGFALDRTTIFDPILPATLLPLLRPALIVLEAHRPTSGRRCSVTTDLLGKTPLLIRN
jgi:ubiquinone/menaquinone biosynthesis C-methylase UbiE